MTASTKRDVLQNTRGFYITGLVAQCDQKVSSLESSECAENF